MQFQKAFQRLEAGEMWLKSCVAALVSAWSFVCRRRKSSDTTASDSVTTSGSPRLFPRNTVFRLQGIPALFCGGPTSEIDVIHLLEQAWNLSESTIPSIHSLATDPLDHSKKIATLTFQICPQCISRPAQRWTKTLPGQAGDLIGLTLDVEFLGLTPVHYIPDTECVYE